MPRSATKSARIRHEYKSGNSVELRFFVVRELRRRNGESDLPRYAMGKTGRTAVV